jgi:hypothetical protein
MLRDKQGWRGKGRKEGGGGNRPEKVDLLQATRLKTFISSPCLPSTAMPGSGGKRHSRSIPTLGPCMKSSRYQNEMVKKVHTSTTTLPALQLQLVWLTAARKAEGRKEWVSPIIDARRCVTVPVGEGDADGSSNEKVIC